VIREDTMARILLVDDEEHICQLYREELGDEGHEIAAVSSGVDLLKKIDLHSPEGVVLDIRLVDYDGLELLQELRTQHHDLPVILCTAYDTYKHDPKAVAADYYVINFSVSIMLGYHNSGFHPRPPLPCPVDIRRQHAFWWKCGSYEIGKLRPGSYGCLPMVTGFGASPLPQHFAGNQRGSLLREIWPPGSFTLAGRHNWSDPTITPDARVELREGP
jgi:CheY-like chemotaxis protein